MKSEEIYLHIGKLLQKFDQIKEDPRNGFKDIQNPTGHFLDLQKEIIERLDLLFLQSDKEDFFWYDCPLTVYSRTLPSRLGYLKKNGYPSLALEELLDNDYRIFDNIPLHGQRYLRTDKKELNLFVGLTYYDLIQTGPYYNPAAENLNTQQSKEIEHLKKILFEKLEKARKKKMHYIQEQFKAKGKMIFKNGYEFEVIDLPIAERFVEVAPLYGNIFSSNGFKLFEYLLESSITSGEWNETEIAYYYRRMKQDDFIIPDHQEPFKRWFNEKYSYSKTLGKFKDVSDAGNKQRKERYSIALEWLKKQ